MERSGSATPGSGDGLRFTLLGEIAAPFRVPLFNALAAREGIDFRAVFLSDADPRRSHYRLHADEMRFDWRVLPGRELRRGGRWVVLSRGVVRELNRFDPDVVGVGGWNQPAFWQALVWTKARRRKLVVWIESTEQDARSEARPLEWARRAMVRTADGFLVPGSAARDYVLSLGVPEQQVVVAPNAVDAQIFGGAVAARGDSCTFAYVGRLDAEKGLDTLLRAFERVPGELVVVGDGSQAERLRRLAGDRVRFTGPLGREAVAATLRTTDVLVLPSRSEPWGMVLNEGAAAGLPLVATEGVGAARDLIEEGANGFVVPVDDEDALAAALSRLADDAELRARMGTRSRELAAAFTPDAWADGVQELLSRVAG